MKYLKYFESSDELTSGKIKEMFLELSDIDWEVQVTINKELAQTGDSDYNNFNFEYVTFFKVNIFRDTTWSITREMEIKNLMKSDTFKEIIEVANERLEYFGWYIDMKTLNTQFSKISFNIYKHEDEKI